MRNRLIVNNCAQAPPLYQAPSDLLTLNGELINLIGTIDNTYVRDNLMFTCQALINPQFYSQSTDLYRSAIYAFRSAVIAIVNLNS